MSGLGVVMDLTPAPLLKGEGVRAALCEVPDRGSLSHSWAGGVVAQNPSGS